MRQENRNKENYYEELKKLTEKIYFLSEDFSHRVETFYHVYFGQSTNVLTQNDVHCTLEYVLEKQEHVKSTINFLLDYILFTEDSGKATIWKVFLSKYTDETNEMNTCLEINQTIYDILTKHSHLNNYATEVVPVICADITMINDDFMRVLDILKENIRLFHYLNIMTYNKYQLEKRKVKEENEQ